MPILKVENLSVSFENNKVVDDVSFEVKKGEVLAIIGPNGAGKTTLFKALLGLIPYKGEVKWQKNVKIGYVPQRIDIDTDIPLTVEEFLKLKSEASQKRIKDILKSIQLDEKILKSGLGEISVGQRQRLLIAWAILDYPDVILFDEPTADVDIYGQESIYKTVSFLRQKLGLTVILISHDLNVVYQYAEKVLCLNHRNLCIGKPSDILKTERLQKLYGGE
ncbi:metal ABC transporter ATP-binding protein, partial [Candidatus Wolfebacteria bacterium]|nr:metal ABC transporter ATP-binding protein [Candidatus Wolfebacteria bacterium]